MERCVRIAVVVATVAAGGWAASVQAQERPSIVWIAGGQYHAVYAVALSPDGELLASAGYDHTIKLWRVSDGELLRSYGEETGIGVASVDFSPDGRLFGYGRFDATVVVARNPLIKGDLNCDGKVNFADINPFVLALRDPVAYKKQYPKCSIMNGDINKDGKIDFGDINPFVLLLSRDQDGNRAD